MKKKTIDTIPVLSEKFKEILTTISKSRMIAVCLVQRCQIILLAELGNTNQKISAKVGLHANYVGIWRNRFLEAIPILNEIEKTIPEKLQEQIISILSDKKRSGSPSKFTQEQILKIIDLACKKPEDFEYEASQWSLNLLVKEIKKQGIVDDISAKSVSRFLKYGRSQTA